MSKLFISDLHLSPDRPELTSLVIDFLNAQKNNIAELYILGDIFNTWLGDDLILDEYKPFIQTLSELSSSGISIYLMVGNRDFMLGKQFAKSVGAMLLNDPYLTEVAGHRCLLMHGDSLCIDDVSYQRYRKWVRNRFLQWLFLKLPLSFRQHISDTIKQQSRQQKEHKTVSIMDANQDEVYNVIREQKVELILHGHTHRPQLHTLTLEDGESAYRLVLGDWQEKVSYALADDHHITLYDHRLENGKVQL